MLLKITDLKKQFNGQQILNGIDLSINKGEVVVIIGPSGSGKTTLLRNLNFLEQADSGLMEFAGEKINLAQATKSEIQMVRRKTAMVFQNYNLFKNKTAQENIAEGLIYGHGENAKTANQKAVQALKNLGLDKRKDYYPSQLSGGQQQRIGIARATVLNPEIILFDEPTSALDPELVGTVLKDIQQLAEQGQTMIVVTHQMWFARNVASRVLFFADGEIIESETPVQIFEHPQKQRTKQFLNALADNY